MACVQYSPVGFSKARYVHVLVHNFTHATVFMTEACEMLDALSPVFFLRLQSTAHSLCFLTPQCQWLYLHDRGRRLKDGFDTLFFLKYCFMALSLCFPSLSETCFHHHDRICHLEDHSHSSFFLGVAPTAISLRFNTRVGKHVYIRGDR